VKVEEVTEEVIRPKPEEKKEAMGSFESESDMAAKKERIKVDYDQMLKEDLFILGRIEEEEDGMLSFNDFDRLFRVIQKHATLRLIDELENDAQKRVSILKKEGLSAAYNKEYRDICLQSKRKEEETYENLTRSICYEVGIEWDAFDNFLHQGLP